MRLVGIISIVFTASPCPLDIPPRGGYRSLPGSPAIRSGDLGDPGREERTRHRAVGNIGSGIEHGEGSDDAAGADHRTTGDRIRHLGALPDRAAVEPRIG